MPADKRDALTQQFDKASRIAAAEPIAVVGIGCRFPGGVNDIDSFWRLLVEGREAVTDVPPDRWNVERFFDEEPGLPGSQERFYARVE